MSETQLTLSRKNLQKKMNEYKISELSVGMTECFERTIAQEMVDAFGDISGDFNPLHTDVDYAVSLGNPGTVVHYIAFDSLSKIS